jgi:hypothetical protein
VLFVAWARTPGRSAEIAAALGGTAVCLWPRWLTGARRTPLRWAWSAAVTVAALVRLRPRTVIATNPPVFPGLLAVGYARVARARVVLDSHPAAFGRKEARAAAWLLPVHRWLARRADAVLVTTGEWVAEVERWGGRALVVHEAPAGPAPPRRSPGSRPRILFAGVFAGDEPVAAVVDAARSLPNCDLVVTGDVGRAAPGLVAGSPANVVFTGFLDGERYAGQLAEADIVLTLTTEPTSVVRAGYEAVYAHRPLVVSDWPVLRDTFPFAVHVANDASSIAAGLRSAVARHAELVDVAPRAAALQHARWASQRRSLAEAIGMDLTEVAS